MRFFFEIFARDLLLSRAFYANAIGLTVRHESPAFVVLERGTAKLHLVSRDHLPAAQRAWLRWHADGMRRGTVF
ncbi:MAG: hypothetical protein ACPG7P_05710 [Candidatus Puniceispirillaceae bacterium]